MSSLHSNDKKLSCQHKNIYSKKDNMMPLQKSIISPTQLPVIAKYPVIQDAFFTSDSHFKMLQML